MCVAIALFGNYFTHVIFVSLHAVFSYSSMTISQELNTQYFKRKMFLKKGVQHSWQSEEAEKTIKSTTLSEENRRV